MYSERASERKSREQTNERTHLGAIAAKYNRKFRLFIGFFFFFFCFILVEFDQQKVEVEVEWRKSFFLKRSKEKKQDFSLSLFIAVVRMLARQKQTVLIMCM